MAANASFSINTSAVYTKATNLATYSGTPKINESLSLDTSSISKVYENTATITTGTTINVSSLTDVYGAALSFATVKGLAIANTSASATLTIGGGSNALYGSDQITLKAGHVVALTSAFAVSTNVNLLLTPSASCGYEILIVGS